MVLDLGDLGIDSVLAGKRERLLFELSIARRRLNSLDGRVAWAGLSSWHVELDLHIYG